MPFTDNPIRHHLHESRRFCLRCGLAMPEEIIQHGRGDTVCQKRVGWFLGDLPWARDCGGST